MGAGKGSRAGSLRARRSRLRLGFWKRWIDPLGIAVGALACGHCCKLPGRRWNFYNPSNPPSRRGDPNWVFTVTPSTFTETARTAVWQVRFHARQPATVSPTFVSAPPRKHGSRFAYGWTRRLTPGCHTHSGSLKSKLVCKQKIKHLTSPKGSWQQLTLCPGEVSTFVNVNRQCRDGLGAVRPNASPLWACVRVYRNTLPPTWLMKTTLSSARCKLVLLRR